MSGYSSICTSTFYNTSEIIIRCSVFDIPQYLQRQTLGGKPPSTAAECESFLKPVLPIIRNQCFGNPVNMTGYCCRTGMLKNQVLPFASTCAEGSNGSVRSSNVSPLRSPFAGVSVTHEWHFHKTQLLAR